MIKRLSFVCIASIAGGG